MEKPADWRSRFRRSQKPVGWAQSPHTSTDGDDVLRILTLLDSSTSFVSQRKNIVHCQRISVTALDLFLAFFVLVLAPPTKADSVTYTFTGVNNSINGDQLSVALSYTAPGFLPLTAPGSFIPLLASQLDSCTNCLVSIVLPAVAFSTQGPIFGDEIDFIDKLGVVSVYEFPLGIFSTPGTYYSTAPFNEGTLTVGPLVSTPEPSSVSLCLLGLVVLAVFWVRKRPLPTQ
jgi:hypothetical protein